jgi:hypothetical protein
LTIQERRKSLPIFTFERRSSGHLSSEVSEQNAAPPTLAETPVGKYKENKKRISDSNLPKRLGVRVAGSPRDSKTSGPPVKN